MNSDEPNGNAPNGSQAPKQGVLFRVLFIGCMMTLFTFMGLALLVSVACGGSCL